MSYRYHFPLDPECPTVDEYMRDLHEDPMTDAVPGDVIGDIVEAFERSHRKRCRRCQEYGAAEVEVVD